jgi:hypothetical protein
VLVGASFQWVPVLVDASFQWVRVFSECQFPVGVSFESWGVMHQLACAVESLALLLHSTRNRTPAPAQDFLPSALCKLKTQNWTHIWNRKYFETGSTNILHLLSGHAGPAVSLHSSRDVIRFESAHSHKRVSTLGHTHTRVSTQESAHAHKIENILDMRVANANLLDFDSLDQHFDTA